MLQAALESYDRANDARVLLDKEGLAFKDKYGQYRPHPAVGIERDSRKNMLSFLRAMNLDVTELHEGGGDLNEREDQARKQLVDERRHIDSRGFGTERHFAREQAIFTHHIASRSRTRKLPVAKSIPAPVIEGGKLAFRPFPLPPNFDFRDHDARVEAFGRAFVFSVTGSLEDFRVATSWILQKFT